MGLRRPVGGPLGLPVVVPVLEGRTGVRLRGVKAVRLLGFRVGVRPRGLKAVRLPGLQVGPRGFRVEVRRREHRAGARLRRRRVARLRECRAAGRKLRVEARRGLRAGVLRALPMVTGARVRTGERRVSRAPVAVRRWPGGLLRMSPGRRLLTMPGWGLRRCRIRGRRPRPGRAWRRLVRRRGRRLRPGPGFRPRVREAVRQGVREVARPGGRVPSRGGAVLPTPMTSTR